MSEYSTREKNELLKQLYQVAEAKKKEPIKSSDDVVLQCLRMRDKKIEIVAFLHLNNSNRVIRRQIMKGTVNQSNVYLREILRIALLCHSASIIMVHNHPGDSDSFSQHDIDCTNKLRECCKLFDISFFDHVLIYSTGHKSMRDTMHW